MRKYKHLDKIPNGVAEGDVIPGTLALEGGGWRGLYTLGVLDSLMISGVNIKTVLGISAGALAGMGYVSRQIGWGARIDLTFRHDKNYCGLKAFRKEGGITGFSYLFNAITKTYPLNKEMFYDKERDFAAGATSLDTGKTEYFHRDECEIFTAVKASASVPFVSRPVFMNGALYLDGACDEKIPYYYAENNYPGEKIVVVKTREWAYRYIEKKSSRLIKMYRKYPLFMESLRTVNSRANALTNELLKKQAEGKVFVIAPSRPVTVSKFEGNMEKLGDLYFLGFNDALNVLDELKGYLRA